MTTDFTRPIDRRNSDSIKWNNFPPDVLPMWVADMDFRAPEPVIQALRERVEHGVFGYSSEPQQLREVLVDRMKSLYGWEIAPESILFMTGVISGLNIACHAVANPGAAALVQTPVYRPILGAPLNAGMLRQEMQLSRQADGTYAVDFDRFEECITTETRLFILCNPHNPVGRVFRRDELERMAEFCLRHHITILSDEIHCDLVYPGHPHLPVASLSPEVSRQTITLVAPSKTFNIAGLKTSFAIVEDADLRARLQDADQGMAGHNNLLGLSAALAAYRDGGEWLRELIATLDENRALLAAGVRDRLPGIEMSALEGTYLAWLDCRSMQITGERAAEFFLREARVGLNDGEWFGKGGEGFVRFNIGCPKSYIEQALERMSAALARQSFREARDRA